MFGVDFSEIALIFLIALVVLGPAKLPQVAQTIGKWVGRARVMARQFREQLEQEANEIKRATDTRTSPTPAAPAPAAAAPPAEAPAAAAPAAGAPATPAAADPMPVPVATAEPVLASGPAEVSGPQEASDPAARAPVAGGTEASPTPAAAPPDAAPTFAHGMAGAGVWPPAPEPQDHPAPLPAEPHERGA
jgi:Tat protein translocase TatB subunit